MITDKSWGLKYTARDSQVLVEKLNISKVAARLLYERGINTKEKAEKFLYGTLSDLVDPWIMQGMKPSVDRIGQAIKDREKIVIYGDYDVDGVCSIVILKECIEMLGGIVDYYVPDRLEEGYGLNMAAVDLLIKQGYRLLISVDCGITSTEETGAANQGGMDMIITDHHTPGEMLPPAIAIINPKLDEQGDNSHLCGAGVAYKLAMALQEGFPGKGEGKWLDLVALATIADVVPLLGDNHILVKYGLKMLEKTERAGLIALLKETGLYNRNITAWQVGFVIAPRLNAVGRLDDARKSVELLTTSREESAARIASHMDMLNNERRKLEETIYEQALHDIYENRRDENNVIVVAGDNWHQGVIGIVASRICEKFYRPAIVVSWEGDRGKGSGRSIKGFDLYQALKNCGRHLEQYGGHQMAAGLSIARDEMAAFTAAMADYSHFLASGGLLNRTLMADAEISVEEVDHGLIAELKTLEPYGEGNPQPDFIIRNMDIGSLLAVGSRKEHVRFSFVREDLEGIAFRKAEYLNFPYKECCHDLLGQLDINEFRGQKKIQIKVKDMKTSFVPDDLKKFRGLKAEPYQHLNRIISEIRAGRPIIILFPTVRCLKKYQPAISCSFRKGFWYCLHGLQDAALNLNNAARLCKGSPGVYLMTAAYFKNFESGRRLPDALKYILTTWPGDSATDYPGREFINEPIFGGYDEAKIMNMIKQGWDYDNSKRTLIYCNRSTTVSALNQQISGLISETGIDNMRKRSHYRRLFERTKPGVFVTDGSYSYNLPFNSIDEVVLADLPFSLGEMVFLADQAAAGRETIIKLPSDQNLFKQNLSYLNKRYPAEAKITIMADYLNHFAGGTIREDSGKILEMINGRQGSDITELELLSILPVLNDLGLCQIRKKGNIMEIMNFAQKTRSLDLIESSLYREGLAEKKAWVEFSSSLPKFN